MKARKYLKVLYLLSVLSLCLPWFTYNANVMGYRFGFVFLSWFAVPLALLAGCLFWPKWNTGMVILGELAHLGNFAALFCALGFWQQVCNIKAGFWLAEGIYTAQPGYWIAVVTFILLFVSNQIELFRFAGNGTQE